MIEKMNILDKLYQDFVVEKVKKTDWKVGSSAPLIVEFDSTEVCNLACPGCISEDLVCQSTSFSRKRLLELAKEMCEAGVKAVILIGGGEPLAHPAIGEFMELLGQGNVHLGITTNGSFIDRHMEVIAKYAQWTRVSMDAATKITFDKLRPAKNGKSEFPHIVENMRKLAFRKRGRLGFSFLIRTEEDGFGIESNIHEIYDAAVLAKEIGCDYFEVKPSYSYVGGQAHALVRHTKTRMQEAKKEIERLAPLASDKFRIIKAINLEASLGGVQISQNKLYTTCPVAQLRTLVCPSGVYVCPYWRGKEQYRIGDVHRVSFQKMWQGEKRQDVMRSVDPSKICNFHCLRDESNRELIKIIESKCKDIKVLAEYDRFI